MIGVSFQPKGVSGGDVRFIPRIGLEGLQKAFVREAHIIAPASSAGSSVFGFGSASGVSFGLGRSETSMQMV